MPLKNVIVPSGNLIASDGSTIVLEPLAVSSAKLGHARVCAGTVRRGVAGAKASILRASRGTASRGYLHCYVARTGYYRVYYTGQPPIAVTVTASLSPIEPGASLEQG